MVEDRNGFRDRIDSLFDKRMSRQVFLGGLAVGSFAIVGVGVTSRLNQTSTPETKLIDGITEWWCRPVAVFLDEPSPRTIFGAIGKDNGSGQAPILACEYNHDTRTVLRIEVATAGVDDHNAPAIWGAKGRRPIIAWSNHNQFDYGEAKVGSQDGDLRTLETAPVQRIQSSLAAGPFSYTQLVHIPALSNDAQDTFWVFSRVSGSDYTWRLLPISVDQKTGVITEGAATERKIGGTTLVSFGKNQGYMTVSDSADVGAGQVIRCAWGYNPNSDTSNLHGVAYFEIDVATGAITSPFDPGLRANIDGTGLPLIASDQVLALEEPPPGWSRRLFYARPGPASRALLYAEGPIDSPDDWIYKQKRETGVSIAAGLHVGANSWVSGAYDPRMHQPAGFEYRTLCNFGSPLSSTAELGRRFRAAGGGGDGNRSWYFRITNTRVFEFAAIRSSDGASTGTQNSAVPVPGNWDDDMGFGFRVDFATGYGVVQFIYSDDGGDTWQNLGDPVQSSDMYTMMDSDCPLEAPSPIGSFRSNGLLRRVSLLALDGTVLADADFVNDWPVEQSTYIDPAGVLWTLQGADAVVQKTTAWTIDEFGIAGRRIGYTAGSNYVPGMAYPEPCFDDKVYAAYMDSESGVSKLVEWRLQDQGTSHQDWVSEVIATNGADDPQLCRPCPPLNGGPHRALVNEVVAYKTFTNYDSNIRIVD